jgi:hypothetical protein
LLDTHEAGAAQTVGPEYPIPPHWPYSVCVAPVGLETAVVVVVVVVVVVDFLVVVANVVELVTAVALLLLLAGGGLTTADEDEEAGGGGGGGEPPVVVPEHPTRLEEMTMSSYQKVFGVPEYDSQPK